MNAPLALDARPELEAPQEIVYPDSDGQPMAENTRQFRWIVTIQGGLDTTFLDDPNVFVAGDLLWYPVQGQPTIRMAPDVLVAFGRPKGDRGSYMQWLEDNIAPQVLFEVLSPGNRPFELLRKLLFYERYGVEECYIYDPDHGELTGWLRVEGHFQEIPTMTGWTSPRLGVRFDLEGTELVLYRPDGQRFLSFVELAKQRDQALQAADQAKQRATAAEAEVARLSALLEQLQKQQEGPQ
jgi:Uma2 family endonuclease